jgi:hypothetical protein
MSSADLKLRPIAWLERRRPLGSVHPLYHEKRQLVPPQADIGQEMVVELIQGDDGGLSTPFLEKLLKGLPQKDQHG